jgi:hypothetical protein
VAGKTDRAALFLPSETAAMGRNSPLPSRRKADDQGPSPELRALRLLASEADEQEGPEPVNRRNRWPGSSSTLAAKQLSAGPIMAARPLAETLGVRVR